jgi:hypothetical protein
MPNPSNAGDRAKAYRLRKLAKRTKLMPVDALWLAEYEENQQQKPKDVGASRSRSGRRIHLDVEEHAEAESVGTGAAAAAAAAALAAKEEGRRLDSLTIESVGALKEAVGVYRDMCLSMRRRMESLEEIHIEMLDAVRTQYLARTQAEINAMEASSAGGDAMTKMAETMLPHLFNGKHGAKPAT